MDFIVSNMGQKLLGIWIRTEDHMTNNKEKKKKTAEGDPQIILIKKLTEKNFKTAVINLTKK